MRFILVFIALFFFAFGRAAEFNGDCRRGVDIIFPVDLTQAQLESISRADGGYNYLIVPGTDGVGNLNSHLANVVLNAKKVPAFREIDVLFSPLASGDAASIINQFNRLLAEVESKKLPVGRFWLSVTEGRAAWPKDLNKNRKTFHEVIEFMEKRLGGPQRVGIHTAAFYFDKIVGPTSGLNKYKLWYMDSDNKEEPTPKSPLNGGFADWKQDEGFMKQYALKVNVGGVEVNKNSRSGPHAACAPAGAPAGAASATPTAAGPTRPGKFKQLQKKVLDAAMLETQGVYMDNSDNRVIMEAQDAKLTPPPARTLEPGLKVEGNWVYVNSNVDQPQQKPAQPPAQPRLAQTQTAAKTQVAAPVVAAKAAPAPAPVAAPAAKAAPAAPAVNAAKAAPAPAAPAAPAAKAQPIAQPRFAQAKTQAKTQTKAQTKAQMEAAAKAKAAAEAKAKVEAAAKAKAAAEAAAAAKAAAEAAAQAKAEAVAQARAEAEASAAMRALLNLEAEIGQELVAEVDAEQLVNSVADRDVDYNQMASLLYDDDLAPIPASNIKAPQPAVAQRTAPVAAARSMLESAAATETQVDVDAETEAEAEAEAEADPLAGDMEAKNALNLLTELDLEDIKQN